MKILFTNFFFAITIFINAQSVFITPIFESKLNINQKSRANEIQSSKLYRYEEFSVLHNDNYLPNSYGLLLGYRFKNQSISISTGIYNSQSESGFRLFFQTYGVSNYIEAKGGVIIRTIPIQLEYEPKCRLNNALSKKHKQILFTGGLAYISSPKTSIETGNGYSIKNSNTDSMIINEYLVIQPNTKFFLKNLMIYAGISLSKFSNKNKELFTLSLRYYHFNTVASYEIVDIYLNQSTPVRYYSKSTGSGIGLSISRNFNFNKFQ